MAALPPHSISDPPRRRLPLQLQRAIRRSLRGCQRKRETELKKKALAKNGNGNAAPIPDAIAVASNGNGRGERAVEAKYEDTEVKIEEERKEENDEDEEKKKVNEVKGIADREEVERQSNTVLKSLMDDKESEMDEDNEGEGEFKLVNEKSKERFMKVFGSVGKGMSREKVENQFDTIPVTEGISDEFDAQMAEKRNARIDEWHASSYIKEKEEVKMMLERYSRKKEKKKEKSLKNEELRKKTML